jgi:hypothetical protein
MITHQQSGSTPAYSLFLHDVFPLGSILSRSITPARFCFSLFMGLPFAFLMLAASVDYSAKHPRLSFPPFFSYYVLDHISYQPGVLAGCLRARSFRSYLIRHIWRLDAEP